MIGRWCVSRVLQTRRLIFVVAGLCAVSQVPPGVRAGADERSPTYSIACRLEFDRDPSLTAPLAAAVRQQIGQAFEAILGSEQSVRFIADSDAAVLPSLPQAEQESIARLWSVPEQLLMVRVARAGSQFVIQAREFDDRFQVLGPVCEFRTMQREMVADAAGRVVLQAFSPLAMVRTATGTNVQIEFLGGSRLAEYREWLGLNGKVGLQVMREPIASNGNASGNGAARATRYRGSFLVIQNWENDRIECELVGPDKLFRDLGSAPVRYVARPVRGVNTSARVQVLRKESRQPQADCEVFVSPQQYATEPNLMRGLTDRAGTLNLKLASGGIQYVSVRFEDLVMKAPILPGASSDPVVFEVPTRGRRAEFIRPLRQLIQEVDDQYLVDVRLREDLKARVEAKDTVEVRKLIERGRKERISQPEVDTRVREIERRAELEGEDVREAAAQVRENAARKISKRIDQDLVAYSDWADKFDKRATVTALTNQINDLQAKMDWEGLIPLFEKLVEADPDNPKPVEELRLLKNDLKVKSPEHGDARAFVKDDLGDISSRDLAGRWREVDRAAHALLTAKDHLTLLKLQRAMNGWARDLGLEVKGLVDQVKAAGNDEDRVQELRDRLERLNELNQSLFKLNKEIREFLATLKL
jgi:hypothetical protein